MRTQHVVILALSLVLSLATLTGCDSNVEFHDAAIGSTADATVNSDGLSSLLKDVRRATARYNSTTQALKAGYEPNDHCAVHPAGPEFGAMGYHWTNPDLVDPVFDPLKPEVMIYEEGPGGNMRLVAVEYVVIDVGQPRPEFDGYAFDIDGVPPLMAAGIPHWSLHVWLFKDNPDGIFQPWNLEVACN